MSARLLRNVRDGWRQWVDRFLGSDPGLNRLRSALQCVLTIAAAFEAEWLFVHFAGALQTVTTGRSSSSTTAAEAAVANHEFLVIAMLLGALVGMMTTFVVTDPTAKGQLVSVLFVPVTMIPALALGLALGDHRVLSLVLIAVVIAAGTYLRRFGPRGFIAGIMFFLGDFFGFFLHVALSLGDLGWLIAELGVGVVIALIIRFALFFPHSDKTLERTQRSYDARARKVANLALGLFDDRDHNARDCQRLHRQLVRLNEAALMIDAQLGDPSAMDEWSSGLLLHQRLFDIELALSNIARFAEAMAHLALPAPQRSEARLALLDIVHQDAPGARAHAMNLLGLLSRAGRPSVVEDDAGSFIVVHRFAESVIAFATSMTDWTTLGRTDGDKGEFAPSVVLFGGWLPGSAQVSAATSVEPGHRRDERLRLAPYTRTAIQMGVAVGLATLIGVQISSYRFYWAVIAVFITFMGTSNSSEQALKASYRVVGTVVGIGIGSLLIDATGHRAYLALAVILIALFLGMYLVRTSYAFMVIGVTVSIAQVYEQLGEFSNSLLLVRLEETAVGAAVAIVVVLTVLPLRTRRVLRVALRAHLRAVGQLAEDATAGLLGQELEVGRTLRGDVRSLDAAHQALIATARPLRRNLVGHLDEEVSQTLRLAAATNHYARNLVIDVGVAGPVPAASRPDLAVAGATLRASVDTMARTLAEPGGATYTRSAALFDRVERRLEEGRAVVGGDELVLRDLMLIDGALAQMAEGLGLAIDDYDTVLAA